MTGGRKQKAAKDLWALASVVMKEFSKLNVGHTIPYNSEIWTNLSLSIFGIDIKQYKRWLRVIGHDNRRGLKDQVPLSRKPKRSQPPDPGLRWSDTEERLHGDTNMKKERPTGSGTLWTSQDSTHSNRQFHVSEDGVDDTSWESGTDETEKPLLQQNDKTNITKDAQPVDQETVGTADNDIKFAEESWAKKERVTASKMGESKFYSVSTSVPHPKRKQSRKVKRHVTTAVDHASEKKFDVSSNPKQDFSTITVPEKNAKQQPTTTKLGEASSAPKKKQQRKA
ncbi:hypothetical protein KOW79_018433 [Hemibagrus wyckioides]|uniref:Uncharacterized protein n=1 Tax=Hemibagrus wyckioides TaxID=337641 RepID=A0A9D3SGH1_9TELE|nr:hypothetical protein KOW79_018433 [Hemibagrus wyckioides]